MYILHADVMDDKVKDFLYGNCYKKHDNISYRVTIFFGWEFIFALFTSDVEFTKIVK